MNLKFICIPFFLALGLLIITCKAKNNSVKSSGPKPYTILLQDSDKIFRFKVNEKFDVALSECVGCADDWHIIQIDNEKIEVLPNTYYRPCKNCNGGSQASTFHFIIKTPGHSILSFNYFSQKFSVNIEGYTTN